MIEISQFYNFQIFFPFVLSCTKHDFYQDFREGAQYVSLENIGEATVPSPRSTAMHCSHIVSWIASIQFCMYVLFRRKLRCTLYNKLLVQLCLALTGLYITFILGTFSSSVPVLCGIISALAHYFFLATFFWMASIAIHIYRSIVQPFKLPFENHFEISGAICWGM